MTSIVKEDISKIASSPLNWDKLNDHSVLVTGATGFIGSFLVNSIMEHVKTTGDDIKVIAMVRNLEKAKAKFGQYADDITYLIGDVTKPVATDIKADYIIHCASNAAPDQYAADPVGTIKINMFG